MVTASAVREHLARTEKFKAALAQAGQKLASRVRDAIGVREAARLTGLSPTYVSHVANGHCVISPGAFLKLSEIL